MPELLKESRRATTPTIPVADLAAALADDAPAEILDAVRAAAEQIGIIQVTGHGVDQALIDDFGRRAGRLLSLPRFHREIRATALN